MATVYCQGKTFQSIRAVLFDKDGTLAQVEDYLKKLGLARSRSITQAVTHSTSAHKSKTSPPDLDSAILATFGLSPDNLDPAGLLAVGSRYDNEVAAAACLAATGWGWIDAIKTVQTAFIQAADTLSPKVTHTPLLPNVYQTLKQLNAVGSAIGIVSSDLHSEVTAFVEHYQLAQVMWHCGFSSDTLPKTHPEFLTFACDAMSVKANETLIIGDSAADYELSTQGAAGFLGMVGGWSRPPDINSAITTFFNFREIEVALEIDQIL